MSTQCPKCRCTFAKKVVGDGCDVCNPPSCQTCKGTGCPFPEHREDCTVHHCPDCKGFHGQPKGMKPEDYIQQLESERDRAIKALREISVWPDGGNKYGQDNIKRFAGAVLAVLQ